HEQHVVRRAADGQPRQVQRWSVDRYVHLVRVELSEAARVDGRRAENRLAEVRPDTRRVVPVSRDRDLRREPGGGSRKQDGKPPSQVETLIGKKWQRPRALV